MDICTKQQVPWSEHLDQIPLNRQTVDSLAVLISHVVIPSHLNYCNATSLHYTTLLTHEPMGIETRLHLARNEQSLFKRISPVEL
jgi:hypothetical protein